MGFELIENTCVVAVYKGVVRKLEEIKGSDPKSFKKTLKQLQVLSIGCKFNKPEQWKPLKSKPCREFDIWELKPKPFRLAFFKDSCKGKKTFVVFAIWRKKGNREDNKRIEKVCREAALFIEKWQKFKGEAGC